MDESQDINAAKEFLERSLSKYSSVIRSLRSYHQHAVLSGRSLETEKIRVYVENNSDGIINCENSGLFAIELDISKIGRRYAKEDPASYNAIIRGVYDSHGLLPAHLKGFWFMLYGEVFGIDCAVLDRGQQQIFSTLSIPPQNRGWQRNSLKSAKNPTQPEN